MLEAFDTKIYGGHRFDIYGTPDEPLFLAVDIAKLIDYSIGHTEQMLSVVEDNEKVCAHYNVGVTSRGFRVRKTQEAWFLTEDGLYEVLMQSRKPIAKQFKAFVKGRIKDYRRNNYGRDVYPDWTEEWNWPSTPIDRVDEFRLNGGDINDPEELFEAGIEAWEVLAGTIKL
jgi:prophage antirepressor-like protein